MKRLELRVTDAITSSVQELRQHGDVARQVDVLVLERLYEEVWEDMFFASRTRMIVSQDRGGR